MINTLSKRLITALLAVLLIVSVFPAQAFAWENNVQSNDEILEPMDINAFANTVLLKQVKSEMDQLLNKYLGTTNMAQSEIEDVVYSMEDEELISAWEEVQAWADKAATITDAEIYFLERY